MSARVFVTTLLAKQATASRGAVSLMQHALDTEEAVRLLFAPDRRWGRSLCRFFCLDDRAQGRFLWHARVAALLHDLGKANFGFQAALRHSLDEPQASRHEHLTSWVMHLPVVRSWLSSNPALDAAIVTAAVLSLRPGAAAEGDWRWDQRQERASELLLDDPDVRALLQRVASLGKLAEPPRLDDRSWALRNLREEARLEGAAALGELSRELGSNPQRRGLLLATKTALIVADSMASGLVGDGRSFTAWIDDLGIANRSS